MAQKASNHFNIPMELMHNDLLEPLEKSLVIQQLLTKKGYMSLEVHCYIL